MKNNNNILILYFLIFVSIIFISINAENSSYIFERPDLLTHHKLFGPVVSYEWPDSSVPFIPALKKNNIIQPLILRNTIASTWPILEKWTPNFFKDPKNIVHTDVTISVPKQSNNPVFIYSSQKNSYFSNYSPPYDEIEQLTLSEVWNKFETEKSVYRYLSTNIEEFPELLEDLNHIEFLQFPQKKDVSINLWMGIENVTAHTHYDRSNNLFFQVYGRKRFILSPPSEYLKLYLFPDIHPKSRQSQVDFQNPNLEKFPNFGKIQAIVADLNPGELLYLPSGWFHRVIALEDSISINFWSGGIHQALEQLEEVPLVIEKDWTLHQKIVWLKYFSNLIFYHIREVQRDDMGLTDLIPEQEIMGKIAKSQYGDLVSDDSFHFTKNCHSNQIEDDEFKLKETEYMVPPAISYANILFKEIAYDVDLLDLQIFFAMERIAQNIMEPTDVVNFFRWCFVEPEIPLAPYFGKDKKSKTII